MVRIGFDVNKTFHFGILTIIFLKYDYRNIKFGLRKNKGEVHIYIIVYNCILANLGRCS